MITIDNYMTISKDSLLAVIHMTQLIVPCAVSYVYYYIGNLTHNPNIVSE